MVECDSEDDQTALFESLFRRHKVAVTREADVGCHHQYALSFPPERAYVRLSFVGYILRREKLPFSTTGLRKVDDSTMAFLMNDGKQNRFVFEKEDVFVLWQSDLAVTTYEMFDLVKLKKWLEGNGCASEEIDWHLEQVKPFSEDGHLPE